MNNKDREFTGYTIGKSGKRYLRYNSSMTKEEAKNSYSNGNRSYYKHYPLDDYPYKFEYKEIEEKFGKKKIK